MNRRQLADEIDALDVQIAELQREKAEFYSAYREDYAKSHEKDDVALEVASVKAAIRQRQRLAKDKDAVVEKDERTDSILVEILGPAKNNAPAANVVPVKAVPEVSTRARTSEPVYDDLEPPPFLDRRQQAVAL